jgi:hypothetical protein
MPAPDLGVFLPSMTPGGSTLGDMAWYRQAGLLAEPHTLLT